ICISLRDLWHIWELRINENIRTELHIHICKKKIPFYRPQGKRIIGRSRSLRIHILMKMMDMNKLAHYKTKLRQLPYRYKT
ncbi:hypothetical protein L9F63_008060, partial [Diploptera punctata]